eukprot:3061895-Prymnesium_polylepis.1
MSMTLGWNAWTDYYFGRKRRQQLLAASGARLIKPKLVACFRVWHDEWDEDQKVKSARLGRQQVRTEKEQRLALEAEVKEIRLQLEVAREAVREAGRREGGREVALALELEAEREKRVEHLQQ